MIIGRIEGANADLGAPPDWNEERLGRCGTLPVKIEEFDPPIMSMTSAWHPTDAELAALNAGAPVYLEIIGNTHPPVMLSVGPTPDPVKPAPETA